MIDNIFYDFDKATLRPESEQALDNLVKLLNENPNVTIELSAHCDFKGSAEYNKRLAQRRVIIFGVGGVGSWCAEALVRTGVHHLTIVDFDRVDVTNVNRQLMATTQTVGQPKVDALRNRFKKQQRFPKRKFKCVFSDELIPEGRGETACGTVVHITAIFGFMLASLVIQNDVSES